MNKIRIIFICSALVLSCTKDKEAFSKGEKVESKNFSGEVWVNFLVEKDSIHDVSIGSVTFAPGAKTNWHYHPGGQILLVTKGRGLYQERNGEIREIRAGEVIKCSPNVEHWHGATDKDSMTHMAIGTQLHKGAVVWLEPVEK